MLKLDVLKKTYFFLVCFLIFIIILTPTLIKDGFSVFPEEFLEGATILILLVIGLVINYFYEGEVKKQERVLQEAWMHIGAVNLLVERFRVALTENGEYPKSKKEMQLYTATMLEKIRGVVYRQHFLLRVVDTDSLNTLFEYDDSSLRENESKLKIGNKELVSGQEEQKLEIIDSLPNVVKVKVFLVFEKGDITADGRMVAQKIINDFAMMYIVSVIFNPSVETSGASS